MDKHHFIKVFELELSNMQDSPVYALKHQLSIGSEIGNIIIADPSVSPRHATFILQEEVVSVVDHGSVAGTFVNGKKIPPGKYIILEEEDLVKVGDLEIRLRMGTVSVPAEEIPEVPTFETEEEKEVTVERILKLEDLPPLPTAEKELPKHSVKKKKFDAKEHLKKNPKKKVTAFIQPNYAANALVRVLAVISDLLLSYSLIIVLMPFDDFREFIEFIPQFVGSLISVDFDLLKEIISEDYKFLAVFISGIYDFIVNTFNFIPLLTMFLLLRLVSTIIFGVSLSEFFLGVRAAGNSLWARIGGGIRVLVGFVTWPLIIFDIPAVISRRTLKEVLTFTRIFILSKFLTVLGVIIFVPLVAGLALFAPLIRGLELPDPIVVNENIDQRVKVKVDEALVDETADTLVTNQSRALNFEITFNPKDLLLVPDFRFYGVKSKLNLKNNLIFFDREFKRQVKWELYKTFDLKQLLGLGMKGNPFLHDKYPLIYNYVYSAENTNPNFKKVTDVKGQMAFANEVISFTKLAFSLGVDNAFDVMMDQTPFLKGLIDYSASFRSLIEYKDFDEVGFVKIGNAIFLRVSFNKQKPFDLIIPLIEGEGHIFKVNWDNKENVGATASRFYKYTMDQTNWLPEFKESEKEVLDALDVYDLFSNKNFKQDLLDSNKAQSLYAYYFETSGDVLRRGDPVEIELWKTKLENIPKLIETLPSSEVPEGESDIKMKLLQNFRDVIDAIENKNFDYFGITDMNTV